MKFVIGVLSLCAFVAAQDNFKECLDKDSISCMQMMFYRKARDFFDQPQIGVAGGLSFVKAAGRESRSFNADSAVVESANDVETREEALENYVFERTKNFFQERSLNLDMASAARGLSTVIPDDVKSSMRALVSEARGKKKILKSLLPILGLVKLKVVGLAILALVGIALIAKKALIVSVIALILSKFLFLKKLLSGKKEESHAYHASSGGWGESSGYGDYGSHSQPAHSIAYAGHKPVRK
ncbi:uncharacterized protein LOC129763262 [Toxorhynchites rutilus septentrionalis]|uniref:uncharacterized protein LOC129763262 n=1 Tax=Toxorhynchites rutilus septentrionalis TaxID=329112 RepID=UPI0024791605|nr:uncharacterized protein LOC129763262 [Toxorhynchites rutilus septentrionalis]